MGRASATPVPSPSPLIFPVLVQWQLRKEITTLKTRGEPQARREGGFNLHRARGNCPGKIKGMLHNVNIDTLILLVLYGVNGFDHQPSASASAELVERVEVGVGVEIL